MNLVREYVSCMDEISQIYEISRQKIEFLRKLRDHYKIIQEFYWGDATQSLHGKDVLLTERIEGAIEKIEKDNENLPRLLSDLKASLDVVISQIPIFNLSPHPSHTALPTTDNRTERTCYHRRV